MHPLKVFNNEEEVVRPLELSLLFVSTNRRHNAKQKAFSAYCPGAVSQFTLSVCLGAGLFVPRRTERHGRIVSPAEEENGTVTVERIGS